MPLVMVNKERKRAPVAAPHPALEYYAPAASNVRPFALAFRDAMKGAIPAKGLEELARRVLARGITALATGRRDERPVDELVDALPWFDASGEMNPAVAEAWSSEPLTRAYENVFRAAVMLEKRKRKVPTVRVNPRSVEWAKERGAKLIREESAKTKEVVRNIVARHIARGERAESMVAAIRRSVGLLQRDEAAVDNRRSLLLSQGVDAGRVESLSDKYAAELLEARATRIARTETIAAQNRGLLDTWTEAAAAGSLPANVVRTWVSAPPSDNPNRPCPICLELDGKTAALDEPFFSGELSEDVLTPPAHPNCRCTMTLGREEGAA